MRLEGGPGGAACAATVRPLRASARLFSILGLEISAGQSMHSKPETPLIIESPALLTSPLSIPSVFRPRVAGRTIRQRQHWRL
jgi:hypothetical protein